jgi:hypothetical protein
MAEIKKSSLVKNFLELISQWDYNVPVTTQWALAIYPDADNLFNIIKDYTQIDVSNFSFSTKNLSTFSPQVSISLDLRFEVVNPEVFFIYEDGYMKNWNIQSIIKQEDRDKKIDYILDGNQESGSNSQFGFYFDDKLES